MGEQLSLEDRILALEANDKILLAENKEQANLIKLLYLRICELEEENRQLRNFKNSSNSSIPPSKDIARITIKKPASGKKTGGQPGHKGAFLEMTDTPDEIIDIMPNYCNCCGSDLSNVESESYSSRQEIDIPPIKAIIKEYRSHSKHCHKCGKVQSSSFPERLKSPVQYGQTIQSIIVYNSAYQMLPFKRMTEFFQNMFNLKISQGTIDNIIKKVAKYAEPIYDYIKRQIEHAKHVGSDETSMRVNGKNKWIWTWQNPSYTYISVSDSRGFQTIKGEFPNGFPDSVLISDRWAAQLKTPAKAHQICTAHLLREFKYCKELDKIDWAQKFIDFLKKCFDVKANNSALETNSSKLQELKNELKSLLYEEISPTAKKSKTLQKSLQKQEQNILTFLTDENTPPDNNGSERAIRNVKIKQKVSGQLKSGVKAFCVLRSIFDTFAKQNKSIFDSTKLIVNFATE
jgi:transposase